MNNKMAELIENAKITPFVKQIRKILESRVAFIVYMNQFKVGESLLKVYMNKCNKVVLEIISC